MSKRVVFLHIEKAAGSTVHDIMYANFFPYYVASPVRYREGVDNQTHYLRNSQLRRIFESTPVLKAAGGHSLRCHDDKLDDDILYFTFLREPTARYLSHYFYQNEIMGLNRGFEDFLRDPYFNNFMCRKICGEESAEKAIGVIEKRNILPCLVEFFDESLIKLKYFLEGNEILKDFSPGYKVANSRSARGVASDADPKSLAKAYQDEIFNNNLQDIELYKYIKNRHFDNVDPAPCLKIKFGYGARTNAGKLIRRIFFVPLEKRVGFDVV